MNEFYRRWLYQNAPRHIFGNEMTFDIEDINSYYEDLFKSQVASQLAQYAILNCLTVEKNTDVNSRRLHGLMYAFSEHELAELLEKLANETAQTFTMRFNPAPNSLEGLPIELRGENE